MQRHPQGRACSTTRWRSSPTTGGGQRRRSRPSRSPGTRARTAPSHERRHRATSAQRSRRRRCRRRAQGRRCRRAASRRRPNASRPNTRCRFSAMPPWSRRTAPLTSTGDRVEVWAPTQNGEAALRSRGPGGRRAGTATSSFTRCMLGGGFGRRGCDPGFRRAGGADRQAGGAAGQGAVDARGGHAPRFLPAGGRWRA